MLAVRLLHVMEAVIERATGRAASPGLRGSANVFGTLIFWIVLMFFITAATQLLGLATFSQWLARVLDYVPTIVAGLLIMAGGIVLSRFAGDLVFAATERLANAQRNALARLTRGATLVAALLVGADQIGIRVTWIAVLVIVVVASVLGGVMIAVSLGARGYVSNLIGARYLRQTFRIGEIVRVAGHEGRVVDVTTTNLVLETAEGRVSLPGRCFHDEAIVLITREAGG
jgi:small-conductance mechanosensitive channel